MERLRHDQAGMLHGAESTIEVRFKNSEGQTESWILDVAVLPTKIEPFDLRAFLLKDNGLRIRSVALDETTDARLSTQAESIGRLLKHLSHHHNELGQRTAEECTWMAAQWASVSTQKEA